jgi:uncharacterized membrane protein
VSNLAPQRGAGETEPDAATAEHRHVVEAVEQLLHRKFAEHLTEVEHSVAKHVREAVSTGRRGLGSAAEVCTPAWMRPTAGETRWPVALAVLVAIVLQMSVPSRLAIPPRELLPVLEGLLLVLLTVANPWRINQERRWLRVASLILVALATLANAYSAIRLVLRLIAGEESESAGPLLLIGGAVWATNVIIFALWYWEFDRGGPAARAHAHKVYPDFQFAQMATPDSAHPDWEPTFVDYLYLSFTNATAFSPTDTLPLTRWAKMLMLSQSAISLATVVLVIARAVNVFR